MSLQAALLLRDGVKNPGDAMAYVIADCIPHIKRRQNDSYGRQKNIDIVPGLKIDARSEHFRDIMDEPFEDQCGKSAENSHKECQQKYEILLLYMTFAPHEEIEETIAQPGVGLLIIWFCICHCCKRELWCLISCLLQAGREASAAKPEHRTEITGRRING